MARLPSPGGDKGTWGDILNDFLSVAHNADGTVKDAGVIAQKYVKPGSGIPKSDLSASVQASLDNADAAVSVPDADATTKGKIQLAGDLAGTAGSPAIAAGAVTNDKVASNAAIAQSKIADLTTDLAGKAAADHTHTATDITDFTASARSAADADNVESRLTDVEDRLDDLTGIQVPSISADSPTVLLTHAERTVV